MLMPSYAINKINIGQYSGESIICEYTIDEKILKAMKSRQVQFENISDANWKKGISNNEMISLFHYSWL